MSASQLANNAYLNTVNTGVAGQVTGIDAYSDFKSLAVGETGAQGSGATGFNVYKNNGADYGDTCVASVRLSDPPGPNPFCKIERFNNDGLVIASQDANDVTTANYFTCGGGNCDITNLTTINGAPYPPPIPAQEKPQASQGAYTFATLAVYPTTLWYGTVASPLGNGETGLLTVCLNFQLEPTAPGFAGPDDITLRFGWDFGAPPNPTQNFSQPIVILHIPDGTTYPTGGWQFSITNQVKVTSAGLNSLAVIAEARSSSGGHGYNINVTTAPYPAGEGVLSLIPCL